MVTLWTFENQAKLDQFTGILKQNGMAYEVENGKTGGGLVISVEEADYQKAKRLLMKHRKRRTSGDFM
jgi:hypothetical protein